MDRRTARRTTQMQQAAKIAARLNAAKDDPTRRDRDARSVLALVARPRLEGRFDRDNGGSGYSRRVLTARRASGDRVTLYFHGNSRTFRVKMESCEPAREQRPLLLDEIRHVSGLIAACVSCGRIYVRSDQRKRFCTKNCAARARQRRRRARTPEALAAARASLARLEDAKVRRNARR